MKIKSKHISLQYFDDFDAVLEKGFSLRKGGPRCSTAFPLDWNADPFLDRNWRFNLHAWRLMDCAVAEFERSGREDAFRFCVDVALDWYKYHFIDAKSTEFSWYDMACGLRASRLAFLFSNPSVLGECASAQELNQLRLLSHAHISVLIDGSNISKNNHAIFQYSGLYSLSSIFLKDSGLHTQFSKSALDKLVSSWFTPDSIHKEHSPEYHKFVVDRLNTLPRGVLSKSARNILDNASDLIQMFSDLDGRFLAIGDTSTKGRRLKKEYYTKAGKVGHVFDFHKSGYWIHQHHQYTFATYAAAFGHAHKHADDLAFLWSDKNGSFFIDGGKYSYDKDEMRSFMISPRAHNTVSVVGLKLKPTDIKWPKSGSGFTNVSQEGRYVKLRGAVSRPGYFIQKREIQYAAGEYIVVSDRLEAGGEHMLESLINIDGNCRVTRIEGDRYRVERKGTVAILSAEGGRVHLFKGAKSPLYGWRSREYRAVEPCYTLALRNKGESNSELVWRIQFESIA